MTISKTDRRCHKLMQMAMFFILVLLSFIAQSLQQSSISLNTAQWFVNNANSSIVVPATVPGGIFTDLRRSGVLKQDLLYGKNDVAYRWVGNENWTYSTSFTIDHHIARAQSVKLVLHGIDTISTVLINGHEIGSTDNMFVRYKFDIKQHLKLAGLPNVLMIKFESPIKYSAKRSAQSLRQNKGKIVPPYCPSPAQRGECHVNFIRKMQASFSWDWGPAFPSVGLYKDIEIEYGSFGKIQDILIETRRLPPLISNNRPSTPMPQIVISSNIRDQVRTPIVNKTVPYIRAPPYYVNKDVQRLLNDQPPTNVEINEASLLEENWLLKTTLVTEMVQPSFGYNIRVEFNLNGILHYESEHINVVANSDGIIRLGFNLRIDPSRMRVKPWWPNNAGAQTLYRLTARIMPIPNPTLPPENIRITGDITKRSAQATDEGPRDPLQLQSRANPPKSQAIPFVTFLATKEEPNSFNMQRVSEKEILFGFRTIELIQEPVTKNSMDDGLTFNFRVNGVDLFAMGSNYIPSSVFPEYSNDLEFARYLLQSTRDANMNMLRVWGGGIYESDEFYKMADEMGIMIWHDFMFACALYPADDSFIATIRTEIEQQVQRLQYHPSIAIWAGNNENEMAIAGPWWPEVMLWNKKLRENYALLYYETIRPIVRVLDPSRPYVESSPSNGLLSLNQPYVIANKPNDNRYGDIHHYDYLADSFDWTNYPSTRFASEYGFQSYPSFDTLASVTTPFDWKYPLTSNILHRQHRLTGETEIKLQIKLHFNEVESGGIDQLKTFIYKSQLTQAIAIKTETEFYRRNRYIDSDTKLGRTMGALYWQLNDVWQAPTWSSIEYGGKWKMLHYFARRFFFPIQVMPYIIHPSGTGGLLQQIYSAGAAFLPGSSNHRGQQTNDNFQHQQPSSSGGSLFVVDLVRDDLFYLLDSFNVTIRFYRWTSFTPVWQDIVYVRNTRPQNVTRIYELEISRITRQPGIVSLSGGVFQVIIEQQPRLGLSQIDNYLMPVSPLRVTAMRVAKVTVEMIQGPFELTDIRTAPDSSQHSQQRHSNEQPSSQWSCAYRLTLVSDSIAMFVWLDLNLINIATTTQSNPNVRPSGGNPIINLGSLPGQSHLGNSSQHSHPPEHIHIHMNGRPRGTGLSTENGPDNWGFMNPISPTGSADNSPSSFEWQNESLKLKARGRRRREKLESPSKFRPLPGTGSDMLRYQFSDNAFNMFEPSKEVDLYLNRCLTKAQIEAGLEIEILANNL